MVIVFAGLFLVFGLSRVSRPISQSQPSQTAPPKFLYEELNGESSTISIANADNPGQRRELLTLAHRNGYGIKARLSPDGAKLAYNALLPEKSDISQASLYVADLAQPKPRLLAEPVDLNSTPVWSLDGTRLAYRHTIQLESGATVTEIYLVDLGTAKASRLIDDDSSLGLYPFAWSRDGTSLYYSRVAQSGTDLAAIEVTSGKQLFSYHITDGIAHDFQLSPGGQNAVFSSMEPKSNVSAVSIVNIRNGSKSPLKGQGLSPIWNPDGMGVTVAADERSGLAISDVRLADKKESRLVSPPADGFDLPLAWSGDARYLALDSFKGKPSQPSNHQLNIVSLADGKRFSLESNGATQFIGWLPANQ